MTTNEREIAFTVADLAHVLRHSPDEFWRALDSESKLALIRLMVLDELRVSPRRMY